MRSKSLTIDVLVQLFINDFNKFTKMMKYINNDKLEEVYNVLKYKDPMYY